MQNSGIYKILFPNGKVYIGLTNDLIRRTKEHNSSAFGTSNDKDLPVHQAIRKYGRLEIGKNVELIEAIPPENRIQLREREKYWITYYSSNKKDKGYNLTVGGDGASLGVDNTSAKLDITQLNEIYDLLMNHKELFIYQIAEKYNISTEAISRINRGKSYFNPALTYPLRDDTTFKVGQQTVKLGIENHQSKFTQADIDKIYDLLANEPSLSLEAIGKQMGVCYGTISNINRGKRYTKEGYDYPIRKTKKKTNKFNENEVQEIYQLLQNPTLSFKDIAQLKNCSVDTIKRLNSGQTYYHSEIIYPIKII